MLNKMAISKFWEKNWEKPFSQINKYANFTLIIHLRRADYFGEKMRVGGGLGAL